MDADLNRAIAMETAGAIRRSRRIRYLDFHIFELKLRPGSHSNRSTKIKGNAFEFYMSRNEQWPVMSKFCFFVDDGAILEVWKGLLSKCRGSKRQKKAEQGAFHKVVIMESGLAEYLIRALRLNVYPTFLHKFSGSGIRQRFVSMLCASYPDQSGWFSCSGWDQKCGAGLGFSRSSRCWGYVVVRLERQTQKI